MSTDHLLVSRPELDCAAMMTKQEMGRTLYDALLGGDQETLRQLLAEDFVGDLTPELPNGYGQQTYQGREVMFTEGWGRVGKDFAVGPNVDEIIATDDYIIGRGDYVGTAVPTASQCELGSPTSGA